MSTREERQIVTWLATAHTGISSETMAYWLGWQVKRGGSFGCSTPSDPADFDRCLQLLAAVPSLRAELPEMRRVSPQWRQLMKHWHAIETCFLYEAGLGWMRSREAPKTYALMKAAEKP